MSNKHKDHPTPAYSIPIPAPAPPCHWGLSPLYTSQLGHTLEIGGWNRGANPSGATIDLTGQEPPTFSASRHFQHIRGEVDKLAYMTVHFPDFQAPPWPRQCWHALAADVRTLLHSSSVAVVCAGGHGRSGAACAILLHILNPTDEDPILRVRRLHCNKAVETFDQVDYVYDMLDLAHNPNVKPPAQDFRPAQDSRPAQRLRGWDWGGDDLLDDYLTGGMGP